MTRTWLVLILMLSLCGRSGADAADWPTWLGTPSRGGCTEEELPDDLTLAWAWRARHAPSPALAPPHASARSGGAGKPIVQTSTSDNSFQVVVAEGKLYFGSSTEECVTCLDAADGRPLWTFYCEGAVRFAPVCHAGRVYFGSDDGYVYCVHGASGDLIWKFRAAIGKRRIIANGRISSQWPVRTGLTIRDDILYAACGIFPSEDRGVMLYALEADTGKPIWKQRLLIHAMGHLLADDKSLIIPAGRAAPLDVKRSDGTRQGYRFVTRRDEGGGSPCMVAGMLVYGPNENGFLKVRTTTEDPPTGLYDKSRVPGWITGLQGWRMVADATRIFILRRNGVYALDRAAFTRALVASSKAFKQRGEERKVFLKRHQQGRDEPVLMEDMKACTKWRAANEAGLVSMIRAGGQIITGGKGVVQAHGVEDGSLLWSAEVEGTVWDLAAADGVVIASTDAGEVYCLRAGGEWGGHPVKDLAPLFDDEKQKPYGDFVKRVLERADTKKGYCVVAGLSDGRLICEIIKQTEFFVVGIESDPATVARVRETLSRSGMYPHPYGKRVTIHQGTYEDLPYLSYFANIILSESAFATGKPPCRADALFPMLQPCGGLMMMAGGMDKQALQQWGQALDGWTVKEEGGMSYGNVVRPKLEGSGEWTHMFADPANTLCSGDKLVAGTRYDIQWIGPPGTERQYGWHDQSMSDLYKDGRLYLTRADYVMAVDAYNGTVLWGADVPGSLRLGVGHESGQACVDSDFLYVAATNDCWLIDAETGAKMRTCTVPDGKSDWGYVSIVGDLLIGSSQNPKATYNIQNQSGKSWGRKPGSRVRTVWGALDNTQVVSSDLFALARADGARRWQYKSGSHILNSSIAVSGPSTGSGQGTVFFVESRNPALPGTDRGIIFLREFFAQDVFLVALDLDTGARKWETPFASKGEEVFYISCIRDALLTVTSANTPFEGEEKDKEKNYYQFRLFDAKDGSERWSRSVVGGKEGYKHGVNIQPAVLMGDKAYLSMRTGGRLFTFDLTTGKCTETGNFRGSKSCGVMTGSATSLFFRNMVSQGYDTVSGQAFWTSSLSRPSCWLNDIPAGGLILMPEATTGCDCAFAMQISIVLAPQK